MVNTDPAPQSGQMIVEDPVDSGFRATDARDYGFFYKRFADFEEALHRGKDLSLEFLKDCPPDAELIQHPFFAEYLREQRTMLPARCEKEIMGEDRNGRPAAVKIGCCQPLSGARPK